MTRRPTDPMPSTLRADGLAYWHQDGHWRLTSAGYDEARRAHPGSVNGAAWLEAQREVLARTQENNR